MPPVVLAAVAIGAAWGGIVGVGAIVATTFGAIIVGGIVGALVGYAFDEFFVPDITSGSSTYNKGQPVYTIEEGKPIAKCYGRCRIAGNIIRSNDPGEDKLKIVIGHGQGEIDSLLAWKINNVEWDHLINIKWWNDAVAAQGTFHLLGVMPSIDETFIIDTQTFTWKTTRSGTGEVTIGANLIEAIANIVIAVTADLTTVTAVDDGINEVLITAVTKGQAGNSIVFTEAMIWAIMDGDGTLGGTTAGANDYAESDHFKNTALGTDSQNPIQVDETDLFTLNACAYRGIAHTGFKFTKNNQISGLQSILVEGRFGLCEPIGGGAKVFTRNPAVIMWDFYRNIEGYAIADLDINAFQSLEELCDFYPTSGDGGPIRPPGANNTTVKATSYHDSRWSPFFAFDFNLAVDGSHIHTSWVASQGHITEQRLNVDLGIPVKLTKIVLVNGHDNGENVTQGMQNFIIQGSNTPGDLDHTTYADAGSGWTDVQTGLTATQYDSDDPYKNYEVANPITAYRYYSIKIANNHGDGSWLKVRDICFWGRSPRYTFDFNFDSKININDAKKLIWSSFNGRVIRSQGKLKPVWDWKTMADGAGSLTTKISQYSFTMDNIVKGSFTWFPRKRANKIKIEYLNSSEGYKKTPVTEKDDSDIDDRGEIISETKAYYITQQDVTARRCRRQIYRAMYADYQCKFSGFPSSQKLEVYDLVTITHTLPSWTSKKFIILDKFEDEHGRPAFLLEAYYAGVFDDLQTPIPDSYFPSPPNPKDIPPPSTNITATLIAPGSGYDYGAVKVSFTPPAEYPFYSHTEIYASKDDSAYYLMGISSGEDFIINGMGTIYEVGNTCYIKLKNISSAGVPELMPSTYDASVNIADIIKVSSFFAGMYDLWGGNEAIGHADTKIVLGNLDGVPKIALGTSADSLSISNMATYAGFFADGQGYFRGGGENKYIQWNGEITIKAGADFLIDSANQKMTLGSGNNLIALDALDATYRLAIGHATYGSAPFRVTKGGAVRAISGTIGGWTLAATTLSSANIILDQDNDKIVVNTITIDGANNRIRSDNYVSGYMGAGFNLDPDLLEVGNIACRGIFRSNIFQMDTISVVGGNVLVRPGDVLDADMVANDEVALSRISEAGDTRISEAGDTRISEGYGGSLTIEGNETFAIGDILRIKTGEPGVLGDDEWLEVSIIANAPVYGVHRDKAGDYAADSNPAWTKGAAVVNYGQSGDGAVYMTASEPNAPYMSIFTHAGEPWNTITTHIRMGNLNGYAGYNSDVYGWAAYIDANNYIKIDPTNGIRMSGSIIITGGSMPGLTLDDLADGASYGRVALTAISAGKIVLTSAGVTGTLPTSLSAAKCINALADQTSANVAASIAGQGALATQNDLDGVPNGSSYGKVLLTSISAGKIILAEVTGDLDDIANGTYGKVLTTAISAGKIVLTSAGVTGTLPTSLSAAKCINALADQTSANVAASIAGQGTLATQNDLDGVPNGSSYGKVLLTSISAGKIVLAEVTGDLDDIADGTYGKVLLTAISAGKIVLTSAGVTGTLPTSLSAAKCINALADQTGVNVAASIAGQGALATQNDLDGVPNGSSYGKVLLTAISAGKIVLTSAGVTGTLPTSLSAAKCTDPNADQTSANQSATVASLFNPVNRISEAGDTRISEAGDTRISEESEHSIDDLSDGTYGKVLSTVISAGKIVLAEVTGDLDDIADGTYGKVKLAVLDSGYLYFLRKSADSTERLLITAGGIEGYANNIKNFELANGIAYLGDQSNEHIKLSSGGLQIYDNTALLATYGANVTIGKVGASKSNVHITAGAIQLRTNTTVKLTLASDGNISLSGGITMSSTGIIKGGQTGFAAGTGFFLGYSGGAYKFSFGSPAKYIKWDGSALNVNGSILNPPSAGNIPVAAAMISTLVEGEHIYKKAKEIYVPQAGTLRIKFTMHKDTGTIYGKIYRNGSPVGTQRTNSTSTPVTYSEDISGWSIGDACQLYAHNGGADQGRIYDFILYADQSLSYVTTVDETNI